MKMQHWQRQHWIGTCLIFLLGLAGCGNSQNQSGAPGGTPGSEAGTFTIISGSENKILQPIAERFAGQKGIQLAMDYRGSVDIMMGLRTGSLAADAVWPANSLWIDLGDKQKQVKYRQSIARMPVVFAVKRAKAASLGWTNKRVKVEDILKAAEAGKLRYMMTSATQSNSGASAYLGYLYAFAGYPDLLKMTDLQKPSVRNKVKRILGTINRTSGSSGWLKDLFLAKYDDYDAMVNYEAVAIEMNQELVNQHKEPLHIIYPADGLAIADSPLGYVDKGDSRKEQFFKDLQAYLLSPEVQQEIVQTGRRAGGVGLTMTGANPAIFNPQWGIDVSRTLVPIKTPEPQVVQAALDLYQTAFRKPSLTFYCLDFSGSMQGEGVEELKSAMRTLLEPSEARKNLLQVSPRDVTGVIPFNHAVMDEWVIKGNETAALEGLLAKVTAMTPEGNTNIYAPSAQAIRAIKKYSLDEYFPAIVLMTDGQSNKGSLADLEAALKETGLKDDVPVFAILFGEADESQLQTLVNLTSGKIFDGRKNLVSAFREVKGYN